jgi:aspartokinase-like uncharacterized kinase
MRKTALIYHSGTHELPDKEIRHFHGIKGDKDVSRVAKIKPKKSRNNQNSKVTPDESITSLFESAKNAYQKGRILSAEQNLLSILQVIQNANGTRKRNVRPKSARPSRNSGYLTDADFSDFGSDDGSLIMIDGISTIPVIYENDFDDPLKSEAVYSKNSKTSSNDIILNAPKPDITITISPAENIPQASSVDTRTPSQVYQTSSNDIVLNEPKPDIIITVSSTENIPQASSVDARTPSQVYQTSSNDIVLNEPKPDIIITVSSTENIPQASSVDARTPSQVYQTSSNDIVLNEPKPDIIVTVSSTENIPQVSSANAKTPSQAPQNSSNDIVFNGPKHDNIITKAPSQASSIEAKIGTISSTIPPNMIATRTAIGLKKNLSNFHYRKNESMDSMDSVVVVVKSLDASISSIFKSSDSMGSPRPSTHVFKSSESMGSPKPSTRSTMGLVKPRSRLTLDQSIEPTEFIIGYDTEFYGTQSTPKTGYVADIRKSNEKLNVQELSRINLKNGSMGAKLSQKNSKKNLSKKQTADIHKGKVEQKIIELNSEIPNGSKKETEGCEINIVAPSPNNSNFNSKTKPSSVPKLSEETPTTANVKRTGSKNLLASVPNLSEETTTTADVKIAKSKNLLSSAPNLSEETPKTADIKRTGSKNLLASVPNLSEETPTTTDVKRTGSRNLLSSVPNLSEETPATADKKRAKSKNLLASVPNLSEQPPITADIKRTGSKNVLANDQNSSEGNVKSADIYRTVSQNLLSKNQPNQNSLKSLQDELKKSQKLLGSRQSNINIETINEMHIGNI